MSCSRAQIFDVKIVARGLACEVSIRGGFICQRPSQLACGPCRAASVDHSLPVDEQTRQTLHHEVSTCEHFRGSYGRAPVRKERFDAVVGHILDQHWDSRELNSPWTVADGCGWFQEQASRLYQTEPQSSGLPDLTLMWLDLVGMDLWASVVYSSWNCSSKLDL